MILRRRRRGLGAYLDSYPAAVAYPLLEELFTAEARRLDGIGTDSARDAAFELRVAIERLWEAHDYRQQFRKQTLRGTAALPESVEQGSSTSDPRGWCSTRMVADRIGLSERQVRNLCDQGAFRSAVRGTGRGRPWRIREDDVLDYIEHQEKSA